MTAVHGRNSWPHTAGTHSRYGLVKGGQTADIRNYILVLTIHNPQGKRKGEKRGRGKTKGLGGKPQSLDLLLLRGYARTRRHSATAPTRTWRRLQLVLGDGSNSYLATLAPTPNPGQVLVVVLAAAGDGVLLSAGGDQEGGSPGSATRAASLTRTGRSSPEVR